MTRPIMWIGCLILVYCILFDLSRGTLPIAFPSKQTVVAKTVQSAETQSLSTYMEVTVQPGDTVLSLVEKNQTNNASVSINKLVEDFKKLNQGLDPLAIQPGKKVFIPIYP
ncbi:LysM peptidoglycan-binding domain-containing protein [Mangrovibacillus cuniculi]|uniref:LysM peptidoglycan-binding domain-containing protein n=1 Tax=Mangrovibacillus cuniculi TaxID=2593652 RepID=A0A7S8HFX7_9BACI|nr:LysM domain-containing protein [Mangrovibacillus cuniculi]QPC46895.1 LysM peptidoglycan-binding domain-containing protein [Mangrovibacillus cuniculi]